MKIGVIGDKQSVLPFKALSFDVFEAVDEKGVRHLVNSLAKDRYAVIFITEQAAQMAEETIAKYKTDAYPAIIPIPSNKGTLGIGKANLSENIEKAIGTSLFIDE